MTEAVCNVPIRRKPRKIEIGDVFNRLTVLSQDITKNKKNFWFVCRCECGSVTSIRAGSLRKGQKTCGCAGHGPKFDLTGSVFGRFTVIGLSPNRSKRGKIQWECRCSCGEIRHIPTNSLIVKNSRSCGCLKRDLTIARCTLPDNEGAFREFYLRYRFGADQRKYEWSLSRESFDKIVRMDCHYCGLEPRLAVRKSREKKFFFNGIDRIDSSAGYVEGNIVPCCKMCNLSKGRMAQTSFLEWLDRLVSHRQKVLVS